MLWDITKSTTPWAVSAGLATYGFLSGLGAAVPYLASVLSITGTGAGLATTISPAVFVGPLLAVLGAVIALKMVPKILEVFEVFYEAALALTFRGQEQEVPVAEIEQEAEFCAQDFVHPSLERQYVHDVAPKLSSIVIHQKHRGGKE